MNQAVEADHLGHRFADRAALADVTFAVPRGAMAALLGPNGGGKTTLFRILSTLLRPSQGDARVFGRSVVSEPDAARRRMGVVFQRPALDVRLTVAENLRHHGMLHGLRGRPLAARAAEALRLMGLSDRAREQAGRLSGGLQRRAELAKALLPGPELLLLDEPTTGLDPGARRDFMAHLAALAAGGVTILLTTHLTDEADRCGLVGILNEGRLVAFDAPGPLKESVGGDVVTASGPDLPGLLPRVKERFGVAPTVLDGTLRVEAREGRALACALVETYPEEVTSVSWGRPTLEDVFMHLTGRRLHDVGIGA